MVKSKEKFHSTRKSVFYYIGHYKDEDPVLSSFPDYFNGIYTDRLIRDVSLGVMPIGGKTKRKNFKMTVVPQDQGIRDLIAGGIAQDDYKRGLTKEVCDFFKDCAQSIMAYGEADYEIAYLSKEEDGKPVRFELVLIPPTTLTQHGEDFYQYLPKDLAMLKESPQHIQLSKHSIIRFQAPSHLRNELMHIIESLSSFSKLAVLPDFTLGNIGNTRVSFDITAFEYSRNLILADIGKSIGWNPFSPLKNAMLEYYWFHRFILFEQFKINLRDNILLTFNEGLNTIGQQLGFSAKLEIEGMPSIEDINIVQTKLNAGDVSFNELLDMFSLL